MSIGVSIYNISVSYEGTLIIIHSVVSLIENYINNVWYIPL